MLMALKSVTNGAIMGQLAARGIVGEVPRRQAAAISDAVHLWAANTLPFSLISLGAVAGALSPSPSNVGLGMFMLPPNPAAASFAPAFGMPGPVPALILDAVSCGLSQAWSFTIWKGKVAGAVGVGAGFNIFVNPATLYAQLDLIYLARFAPGAMTGAKRAMVNALTLSIASQFQIGVYAPMTGIGVPLPVPGAGVASNEPHAGPILSIPFSKWIPA